MIQSALVLGAGQIGTFAARALASEGVRVVAADVAPARGYFWRYAPDSATDLVQADLLDSDALSRLVRTYRPDAIVLSAGIVGEACASDPARAWAVNVDGAEAVVGVVRQANIGRLVAISTLAVYGPRVTRVRETAKLKPRSEYGRTKAAAERVLAQVLREDVELRVLRLCGSYGPLRLGGGSHSARFIESALLAAIRTRKISIKATKSTSDQYLYVKDLGRAVALAVLGDTDASDHVFNVGPGAVTTPDDLRRALNEVVPEARVELVSSADAAAPLPALDVSRFRNAFGFAPRYTLAEGLSDYAREAGFLP